MLSYGWDLDAKHVRGRFNVATDGISRWDRDSVLRNLRSVRPGAYLQARELGDAGKSPCTSVLASSSCATQLQSCLNIPFWGILAPG